MYIITKTCEKKIENVNNRISTINSH